MLCCTCTLAEILAHWRLFLLNDQGAAAATTAAGCQQCRPAVHLCHTCASMPHKLYNLRKLSALSCLQLSTHCGGTTTQVV
jgi:hypothetical protein